MIAAKKRTIRAIALRSSLYHLFFSSYTIESCIKNWWLVHVSLYVLRRFFAKTYPKSVTFDRFFKTKKKKSKIKKIGKNLDVFTNFLFTIFNH